MIIYKEDFDTPDPKDARYSQMEVDFYGFIPTSKEHDNHRLSVRKVMATGKYQVYAHYYRTIRRADFDKELFEGTLEDALRYADNLFFKFHQTRHYDKVEESRLVHLNNHAAEIDAKYAKRGD